MSKDGMATFPLTETFAAWAGKAGPDTLPADILQESTRAFLNWVGCAYGGSREEVTRRAVTVTRREAGPATLIGHGLRAERGDAAFLNCVASSALAYDDTHLATVTHPTGPVAAALLAWTESHKVRGADFLAALAIGIELQCRLSNLLLLPPAKPNLALYITGVTGPIGGAAALARLMGLGPQQINWAMGHAATQAAGFRATHGSMAGVVVPAFAARSSVLAAELAQAGINCSENALEDPRGFVGIFTSGADLALAAAELDQHFELLANAYKPYPAGIVLHAAIDACLALVPKRPDPEAITAIDVHVPPLTVALANRVHPGTPYEAPVSLQHWAAHVLLYGTAGTEALGQPRIDDPAIARLRERVRIHSVEGYARDEARAAITLADGSQHAAYIAHATGSIAKPMTDAELDRKFLDQTAPILGTEKAEALRVQLRDLARVEDVGAALQPWLKIGR